MRFSLSPRLIGTFTAATLALTTFTAAPAFADDERAARAIATLLGIAVIGSILNDREDHKSERQNAVRNPARTHEQAQRHRHGSQSHAHVIDRSPHTHRNRVGNRVIKPKVLPRRVSRKLLPQNCLRSFHTRDGRARLFTQRCLERSYKHVNSLPDRCFRRVRTDQGKRRGYSARCLNRAGYSLARR